MTDLAGFGLGCAEAAVTGDLEVSGTLIANPDGTLMDNTRMSGETVFELPPECLVVSGTVTSCDRVGGPIEESLGYSQVECVDAASGGCTCTGTVDQAGGIAFLSYEASESGTFATADTTITLSNSADDVQYGYCVEENTLTMTPLTVNRIGTVMGTVVLLKQ
jgi:hypothetical protein